MDMISTVLRRVSRATVIAGGVAVGLAASPAEAKPPSTWETPDNPSFLHQLLLLGGVPVVVFLVLTLAVYLPTMMRRGSAEPAVAFQERSEWFGGPRKGVAATAESAGDGDKKGGASAGW
jgi:hypothetical protein